MNWQCWDFGLSEICQKCWEGTEGTCFLLMFCHLLWYFCFWEVSFSCSSSDWIKFIVCFGISCVEIDHERGMDANKRVILLRSLNVLNLQNPPCFNFAILQLTLSKKSMQSSGTPSSIWRWSTGAIVFQMPGRGGSIQHVPCEIFIDGYLALFKYFQWSLEGCYVLWITLISRKMKVPLRTYYVIECSNERRTFERRVSVSLWNVFRFYSSPYIGSSTCRYFWTSIWTIIASSSNED